MQVLSRDLGGLGFLGCPNGDVPFLWGFPESNPPIQSPKAGGRPLTRAMVFNGWTRSKLDSLCFGLYQELAMIYSRRWLLLLSDLLPSKWALQNCFETYIAIYCNHILLSRSQKKHLLL